MVAPTRSRPAARRATPHGGDGRPGVGYRLFATAIGTCAVAWRGDRLVAVSLPGPSPEATAEALRAQHPGAEPADPPPAVDRAIAAVTAHLAGRPAELSGIGLELDGIGPFARRVYDAARRLRPGETVTYGELARRIGAPGAARAVGQALGRNPFPIVVPCHRIVAAGGRLGGFSADGGLRTKRRLLALEGAPVPADEHDAASDARSGDRAP